MIELYTQKGISREDAELMVLTMSKYKPFFVDVMMKEELGLLAPEKLNFLLNGEDSFFEKNISFFLLFFLKVWLLFYLLL